MDLPAAVLPLHRIQCGMYARRIIDVRDGATLELPPDE
jgi:hypothetical protein